jgi:hypothetical protein
VFASTSAQHGTVHDTADVFDKVPRHLAKSR